MADGNQEEAPAADIAAIQQQIIAIVKGYVDDDVDMEKPLAMQGLDSLAFMELRQKLEVRQPGSTRPLSKNLCGREIVKVQIVKLHEFHMLP